MSNEKKTETTKTAAMPPSIPSKVPTKKPTKKPGAPGAAARSDTEWHTHATADAGTSYEQADWVEPEAGLVLEGTLMRAFVIPDSMGGKKDYRAAYVFADENGNEWTFGEKAGFRRAIHAERLGVTFQLTFIGKEAQRDSRGQPTAKTIWVTEFKTKGRGVGNVVRDELIASHKALTEAGEDLPF